MANLAQGVESSVRTLFRRCLQCPNENPSCPACAEDETCSLQVKTCSSCAFTSCVKRSTVSPGSSTQAPTVSTPQSAVGPIVGGVIGGLVLVAILTYLVWRFCIKNRRNEMPIGWQVGEGMEKSGMGQDPMQRDPRASTHTVASLASVFTRASNIIQIAYIPGVTNRSIHSSPDLVPPVPPVPPIPAASPNGSPATSPHLAHDGEHYFLPSDLRNSTYSYTDRSSMARTSVASTMYRNNAVVNPMPARAVTRMKAIPVSVKSSSKTSPNVSRSATPPPQGGNNSSTLSPQSSHQMLNTKSSIVGRVGVPRAVTVTRKPSQLSQKQDIHELEGSSGSEPSLSPFIGLDRRAVVTAASGGGVGSPGYSDASSTSSPDDDDDDDDYEDDGPATANAHQCLIPPQRRSENSDSSAGITNISDRSPVSPQSTSVPALFSGNSPNLGGGSGSAAVSRLDTHSLRSRSERSLNAAIEEATRRATQSPAHGGLGSFAGEHGENEVHELDSPFTDEHAA